MSPTVYDCTDAHMHVEHDSSKIDLGRMLHDGTVRLGLDPSGLTVDQIVAAMQTDPEHGWRISKSHLGSVVVDVTPARSASKVVL